MCEIKALSQRLPSKIIVMLGFFNKRQKIIVQPISKAYIPLTRTVFPLYP